MRLRLQIEGLQKIRKKMLKEMVKKFNQAIRAAANEIKTNIQKITEKLMYRSTFFQELEKGELRGHFGIPEEAVQPVIRKIIEEIVSNIDVVVTNISTYQETKIRGGLQVVISKDGFQNLLDLRAGKIQTEAGEMLDWLEWVLTQGDTVIISGYEIAFADEEELGRSGLAIMIPSHSGHWRVPPEFSGTINDNFITKEIIANLERYEEVVGRLINKYLKRIYG